MTSVFLIIGACAIAYWKPRIGVILFLVLHSSLFHLGTRFSTIHFGAGYAGTADLLPLILVVSAIRYGHKTCLNFRYDSLSRAILLYLIIYLAWSVLGSLVGVMVSQDSSRTKFSLRYCIGLIYWLLFTLPFVFRDGRLTLKQSFFCVIIATAGIDLLIKVSNMRTLMLPAYFLPNLNEYAWIAESREKAADSGWFRSGAQGAGGIHLVGLYLLTYLLYNSLPGIKFAFFFLGAVVCLLVPVITVDRSVIVCEVAALVFVILMHFVIVRRSNGLNLNSIGKFVVLLLGAAIFAGAVMPQTFTLTRDRLTERFENLGDEVNVFDPSTGNRGWDNYASMRAITDFPLLGVGCPRYPESYSVRPKAYNTPTDIMPLFKVGLVCGLPGIALVLLLLFYVFYCALKVIIYRPMAAGRFLPYLAVFLMVLLKSLSGAGSFLEGAPLASYSLFIGFFLAEWHAINKGLLIIRTCEQE